MKPEEVPVWERQDRDRTGHVFALFAGRLRNLAQGLIGWRLARRMDADDIVQTAFRTFLRRVQNGEYAINQSQAVWRLLAQIATNKVRCKARFHRAQRRDVRAEIYADGSVELPELLAIGMAPEGVHHLRQTIEEILERLSERDGTMVRLCLEGCTTSEISAQVGRTRSTVRRVLNRFRQRLEREISENSRE